MFFMSFFYLQKKKDFRVLWAKSWNAGVDVCMEYMKKALKHLKNLVCNSMWKANTKNYLKNLWSVSANVNYISLSFKGDQMSKNLKSFTKFPHLPRIFHGNYSKMKMSLKKDNLDTQLTFLLKNSKWEPFDVNCIMCVDVGGKNIDRMEKISNPFWKLHRNASEIQSKEIFTLGLTGWKKLLEI